MLKALKAIFRNDNKKQITKKRLVSLNNSIISTLFSVDASKYVESLSDEEIDVILRDLTLSQVIESRKAATEKKELQIITKKEDLKDIAEGIFSTDVISQVLDTHIFGFNVFELNYKLKNNLLVPVPVQRDYRDFLIKNGELFYNSGYGESIEKYKALYLLYRPRFNKPYGDSLLSRVYFPIKIKNASWQFWVTFLEKFGSPWAIGKTEGEPEELADEIHAMLSGDTAVVDIDDEISLIQPTSTSKESFESVINYCDKQIRNVVLGANLSSEVTGGSLAASQTHNKVREDIADADARILESFINKTIEVFKEVNGLSDELWVKLFGEGDPKLELSSRDVNISNMGFKPTKEYIEETYNIKVEEITEPQTFANKERLKGDLKAFKSILKDDIDDGIDSLLQNKTIENEILKVFEGILESSNSYEEAQMALLEHYKDVEFSELEEILRRAIFNSTLLGSHNAKRI
ncbi:MAG: DUF935 family protein [Campylobacteraceae bacterium]